MKSFIIVAALALVALANMSQADAYSCTQRCVPDGFGGYTCHTICG